MCIMLILIILFHSLDLAQEEPELEAQVNQAKEANSEPDQDKPRCITQPPLTFNLNLYFYVKVNCALD
jgi:hypothetical protein